MKTLATSTLASVVALGAVTHGAIIVDATQYVSERLDDQIEWYDHSSLSNQNRYKCLRMIQFVAAGLIPFLTPYLSATTPTGKLLVGFLGVVVAIITAALDLYRFQEHWIEYRTTCESLKKEKYLFLAGGAPYSGDRDAAFRLLVQRAETLISKENSEWAQVARTPRQENNSG